MASASESGKLEFEGSRGDALAGIRHTETIFRAARGPRSFVSLDDADHLLSGRSDAEYAAEVLAAWASRYVEARTGRG